MRRPTIFADFDRSKALFYGPIRIYREQDQERARGRDSESGLVPHILTLDTV